MVLPSGILWAGPVRDIGGYGNASRNYIRALQHTGLPLNVIDIGPVDQELGENDFHFISNALNSNVPLGNTPVLLIHGQPEYFDRIKKGNFIKKIGITVFETDRIPQHWANLCNTMDEIWVFTHFNYETFTKYGVQSSKVKILNHTIDFAQYDNIFPPYPFPSEVKSFRFLYTMAFDYRKGLDLLIPSFCEEFSNTEDVSLILKIYVPNWTKEDNVLDVISSYIPDKINNPHIHFIMGKIPRESLLSLYSSCTCYVSTERALGWGMPQMEMMAMGKPVISVNWGGPTEFMNESNSFLLEPEKELEPVHDELQKARPELYLGHNWAKVTKQTVKKTMREAFENHKKREEIALKAKLDIKNRFSLECISKQFIELLYSPISIETIVIMISNLLRIPNNLEFIVQVYRNLLGREPDEQGLKTHLFVLQRRISRLFVITEILKSAEYRSILSESLTGIIPEMIIQEMKGYSNNRFLR